MFYVKKILEKQSKKFYRIDTRLQNDSFGVMPSFPTRAVPKKTYLEHTLRRRPEPDNVKQR